MNTATTKSKTGAKIAALSRVAVWRNNKILVVRLGDLAGLQPGWLPSYREQKAGEADRPDDFHVYDAEKGYLLFSASCEPIYERGVKVAMPDGFSFHTRNTEMTIGGDTFPFSDIILHWVGEPGATIELVEQDATWEPAIFERIQGFAPGTMLVVEDCKWNGQRLLMASEFKFGIRHILEYNAWLPNSYWTVADWAKLPMWDGHSDWGYFEAHKGKRTAVAKGKTSTIWIYITA